MYDPETLKKDAEYIIKKLSENKPEIKFKAIVLKGTGHNPCQDEDKSKIINAVNELIS